MTLGFMGHDHWEYKASMTDTWTRVLFEAIDDAVFVHDEAGNILDANPGPRAGAWAIRAMSFFGSPRATSMPRSSPPVFRMILSTRRRASWPSKASIAPRMAVHHVDINTGDSTTPTVRASGDVDITSARRPRMLNKQSELLQSILDNMSDAIVVADAHGRIMPRQTICNRPVDAQQH